MNRAEINKVHTQIFEAATEVYNLLGPGLPPATYRSCFLHELRLKDVLFKKDVIFPIIFKGYKAGEIKIDVVVENNVMVEFLPDPEIIALHIASLQSKLKLSGFRMGILITFNTLNMIDGYRKILINQ
ncbi:MAG: GxxExxY protein [Lentimicrobiaceae bacterium]